MAEKPITFLPFLVRNFSGLQNSTTGPGHLESTVDLRIVQDTGDEPVRKRLVFRGPGDVIHPRMIARLEPPTAPPTSSPTIFHLLSSPIRTSCGVTPWVAGATERMHPWLSLLVLTKAEMDEMERDDGIEVISCLRDHREFLSVRGDLVPSLDHVWATAHVHLNGMPSDAELPEFVAHNPASHCCRLLCCRRLLPETHYAAFLVPNYRIAVDVALGLGESTAGAAKAWNQPARRDVLRLPIYYRWAFMTSEKGDFEELAGKLVPTAVNPARVGT